MATPNPLTDAFGDYPQDIRLDNGQTLTLRPAGDGDQAAIVSFAKGLNEGDLLFLRVDITQAHVVDHWLTNIRGGDTTSILALDGERVAGYATIDRNSARWTRRVGELRVNVAPDLRSQGLGRHLTAKVFDLAQRLGLKKLVAHMTPEQAGAQAAFMRLGFQSEALLADFVEDRDGNTHDMLIMSYDIDGLTNQMDDPLRL